MKVDIKNVEDGIYQLTIEEFEDFLNTTSWEESVKNTHRLEFKGKIEFLDNNITY